MKKISKAESLIEIAVDRLTNEIVRSELAPGQKLLIAELKERYAMGASPIREALSRLCSLGFVIFDSGRGFRVTPISKEDLEDIIILREVIETEALRRSISNGDDEWEVGIVAAFARLERASRPGEMAGLVPLEAEGAHKQFHTALVSACGSKRMIDSINNLYDQAHRYRYQMLEKTFDLEGFLQHHKKLVDSTLARNAEVACTEIADHLRITVNKVYPGPKQ